MDDLKRYLITPLSEDHIPVEVGSVLIVDDDHIACDLIVRTLNRFGIQQVLVAPTAESALKMLQSASVQVNCMLVDLAMPYMNGYELCHTVREELHLTHLPIVAISATSWADACQRVTAAGFNYLVPKPAPPLVLKQIVCRCMHEA